MCIIVVTEKAFSGGQAFAEALAGRPGISIRRLGDFSRASGGLGR